VTDSDSVLGSRVTRRSLLKAAPALLAAAGTGRITDMPASSTGQAQGKEDKRGFGVSVVQFRSSSDIRENAARHCEYIAKCAAEKARVVVFPECSLSGYSDEAVARATSEELSRAEATVAGAAAKAGVYAIVGGPTRQGTKVFNSALVVTPKGEIIERYHKVQLAGERWATPGDHLSVFPIDGVLCSIIICHDERYPELVRLPVLAGSRIVFYISHESGMDEEQKIAPYRAQVMARAVENGVFLVHANAPGDKETGRGSHGQSRIVKPDGNILSEAGIYTEEVIAATIDRSHASAAYAKGSLRCDFLKAWWDEGAARVRRIEA
jgi:predicted amidohydrolase